MSASVKLTRSGKIGLVEIDNPPVNTSSQSVRSGLMDVFQAVREDSSIHAAVVYCAGRTFMAGGDIQEFNLPQIGSPHPHEVFEAIESLDRPVIAALHGSVLGGGLELALACHYRIALESAVFGMPEVKLGVIPGGGGTQRLPRIAGIQVALDMMTRGEPLPAQRALQLGIIDAVVDGDLLDHAIVEAKRLFTENVRPRRSSQQRLVRSGIEPSYFDDYRHKLPPAARGGNAAREIVSCLEAALDTSFEEGLRLEREVFEACKASSESKALRHVFFAEREAARGPELKGKPAIAEIGTIGIVGAGTMGSGIATSFANAGIKVVLIDVTSEALQRGIAAIHRNFEVASSKGRISAEQAGERASLVRGTLNDQELESCDLIVEAAFEDLAIKKSLWAHLSALCKPGAILASNTSTLDIDALAAASGRPSDFLGMHFFSPAHVMKLLEVVRGAETSPEVLTTIMGLAKRIGKSPVISGVCYGFIGNRMLEGYLREAEFLLMEGATPTQIDRALEETGMAMGPCRMVDMAGVDVAAGVVLERGKMGGLPDDPSYRAVVRRLYEFGRYGQKTSAGYYRYEERVAIEDAHIQEICRELAREHGIVQRKDISNSEIVERCLFPLINEGARILEEGIAYRASDIDVVWVLGYGFPAYKGGPMYMANMLGASYMVETLRKYGTSLGNNHGYWSPANLLVRAACTNAPISTLVE